MGHQIVNMQEFRQDITKLKPEFAMALPDDFSADRMARMCITVVQQNPRLLECTRRSLLGAMMTAAQLGLYPDVSVLGHAYFLPFRVHGTMTVTFVAGYKGLIDLATRSGRVTSIMAYPVHEGDDFKFAYGTDPFITHVPNGEPIEDREITHVYAMARLRGERKPQFVVMAREEVESIRKRSPGKNLAPWTEHWEQMALKTSIRRLCKYLPLSSHLQRAVALDEAVDSGVPQNLEGAVDLDVLDAIDDGIVDGEVIDDDAIGTVDSLDDLLGEMKSADSGPSDYEKLCINGMEVFGDDNWRAKLIELKRVVADKQLSADKAPGAMLTAMKKAIKGGR